jgi:hypothetical protein
MAGSDMLQNSFNAVTDTQVRALVEEAARETPEDAASYLFDLLVAARRLAVTRRHRFLAYLIGMAAEEARLLTMGRSAVRSASLKTTS